MDIFKIKIGGTQFKEDFTVIYKGLKEQNNNKEEVIEEIRTSKDEFIRKLRYFKNKIHELEQTNEIFIHDIYPVAIFREFIKSLKTNEISITEQNYPLFCQLCSKYQYEELQIEMENFSQQRPDVNETIDYLINQSSSNLEIDTKKEEKISRHLDIFLQNENIINIPLPILVRILNSPTRELNDHHLLVKLVHKVIQRYSKDENSVQYFQPLLNSLDYLQMSNEELDELFHSEHFKQLQNANHSSDRMLQMIEERKAFEQRFKALEDKFEEILKNQESERKTMEDKIQRLNVQLNDQNEALKNQSNERKTMADKIQRLNEQLKNQDEILKNQSNERKTMEDKIQRLNEQLNDQNEALKNQSNERETMADKIQRLDEQLNDQNEIIRKHEEEISKLKETVKNQETKLNQHEALIAEGKKELSRLECKVSLNLQSNDTLNGNISIIEKGACLDYSRSKYILNTSSSSSLGEQAYESGTRIESLNENLSFKERPGTYYLHALVVDNLGRMNEHVSSGVKIVKPAMTFDYTGHVQAVALDAGDYKLEVWGAEGGKTKDYSKTAGKGGYSVGTITLATKTTLYVYVGECPSTNKGGWNGGGAGGKPTEYGLPAGGGGSTDISLCGEEGSQEWNNHNHMHSRIIVAGAGGGSGTDKRNNPVYITFIGGFGGGEEGQSSGYGPKENGGTQNRAGKNTECSSGQSFGVGGSHTGNSSGGGSGWYGGGASKNNANHSGGAGGSGYVYSQSTASNYPSGCKLNSSLYLKNASTHSGNTSFPSPNGSSETGHTGHGYARITPQ